MTEHLPLLPKARLIERLNTARQERDQARAAARYWMRRHAEISPEEHDETGGRCHPLTPRIVAHNVAVLEAELTAYADARRARKETP